MNRKTYRRPNMILGMILAICNVYTSLILGLYQFDTFDFETFHYEACINMGMIFLVCSRCDKMKERFIMDEKFSFVNENPPVCKDCAEKFDSIKQKELVEKKQNTKPYRHVKQYWPGLTGKEAVQKYRTMLKQVGNRCEICKQKQIKPRLAVDHCHLTGKVRGLLCGNCNRALGLFADSKVRLIDAIEYLEK